MSRGLTVLIIYSCISENWDFLVTTAKSQYAHLFNTTENTKLVGPAPDVSYYGMEQMREAEIVEFLSWNHLVAKIEAFDNRLLLERYGK